MHQESLCKIPENGTCYEYHNTSSYKSQRFESLPVQVFSGGDRFGIQRRAVSHRGEMAKPRKSTE